MGGAGNLRVTTLVDLPSNYLGNQVETPANGNDPAVTPPASDAIMKDIPRPPFITGTFRSPEKSLCLPLHVHQFLQHLVGYGDNAGVGLIAALGGNHLRELVGHIGAGGLQAAVLHRVVCILHSAETNGLNRYPSYKDEIVKQGNANGAKVNGTQIASMWVTPSGLSALAMAI